MWRSFPTTLGRYMYWVFVQGWGVSRSVSFRFHESGQTQIRWLILSFGSETFLDPRLPRSQFIPEAACTPHTAKHAGQPDYDYTKKDHSLVYPWSMRQKAEGRRSENGHRVMSNDLTCTGTFSSDSKVSTILHTL